jgi:Transposase IS200 like
MWSSAAVGIGGHQRSIVSQLAPTSWSKQRRRHGSACARALQLQGWHRHSHHGIHLIGDSSCRSGLPLFCCTHRPIHNPSWRRPERAPPASCWQRRRADHLHILLEFPPKRSVSVLVHAFKGTSNASQEPARRRLSLSRRFFVVADRFHCVGRQQASPFRRGGSALALLLDIRLDDHRALKIW